MTFDFSTISMTNLLLIVIVNFLSIHQYFIASVPSQLIRGAKVSCNQEGQIVVIPFLKQDPCITCMCLNSEIDCFKNTCNDTVNCYYFDDDPTTSGCCRKCKDCRLNGMILENGDHSQNENDPCKSYYCNSGTLTESRTECHVPCQKPISLLGHCCPSCGVCSQNDGERIDVRHVHDSCISCHCFKGQKICTREVCPVLPCPPSHQIKSSKNSCCSICRGSHQKNDHDLTNKFSCEFNAKTYPEQAEVIPDECTKCRCQNSTMICQRSLCPILSCPIQEQIKHENQCCSQCQSRVKKEMSLGCSIKNRHFKENEKWTDDCRQCQCLNGQINCIDPACPPQDFVCPFGHQKARLNGECCDSCVREDRKCIVMDSLTNFTTFDGFNYQWNERCNYVLARDCSSRREFSIHLYNKFHKSSNHLGSALFVKVQNTRIFFSHVGRIRVNRSLVNAPYLKIGQFSIVQIDGQIKLRATIGLDVSWRLNRSLEIKVRSHFQDQTCGLCGNYNLDPDDEFHHQGKNKRNVISLKNFVDSFKIGENLFCPRQLTMEKNLKKLDQKTELLCEFKHQSSQNKAWRACQRIKRQCESSQIHTGTDIIYSKCLEKICECQEDRRCICNTKKTFLEQCPTTGEKIPDRSNGSKETMCHAFDCPPGSVYKTCSFDCEKTCLNHNKLKTKKCVRKKCRSGCFCLGNRIWYNGQCLPEMVVCS